MFERHKGLKSQCSNEPGRNSIQNIMTILGYPHPGNLEISTEVVVAKHIHNSICFLNGRQWNSTVLIKSLPSEVAKTIAIIAERATRATTAQHIGTCQRQEIDCLRIMSMDLHGSC